MTLATSAAPLNIERRDTRVSGTRAVVSSEQLIGWSGRRRPRENGIGAARIWGWWPQGDTTRHPPGVNSDYFAKARAEPGTFFSPGADRRIASSAGAGAIGSSLARRRRRHNRRGRRNGASNGAAVVRFTTCVAVAAPAGAMARPESFRRDDAERDAGRGRGVELRPNVRRDERAHGRADAGGARQQQRAEQAQLGGRGKGREQQRERDQPSDPGERLDLGSECTRQVGGGRLREGRVVVVVAESHIALAAQQPAHPAGPLAMIDAEHEPRPPADGPGAVLAPQELAVVFVGEPVAARAFVSSSGTPSPFPGFVSIVFLVAVAA